MLGKLVYIEWVDSSTPGEDGWHRLEDVDTDHIRVKSVGWVKEETDEHVVVVPHETDGGQVDGTMTVPKVSVTKLLILEVPGARASTDC